MSEQKSRRAGEPGRRPEPVPRDGSPRRELAYWLRQALDEHGSPTIDSLVRALPDEVRLSRSALGKALRGETFPEQSLVRAVLDCAGADRATLDSWRAYWYYLDHLERLSHDGVPVAALPPRWAGPAGDDPDVPAERGAVPEPARGAGLGRVLVLALTVTCLLVGAGLPIVGFSVYRLFLPAAVAVAPATATIITPETSTVPRTFPLLGSYRDLPVGTLIWVTTFDPVKGRYYPQDKPCVALPDGTFNCGQYYLGEQTVPDRSSYRIDVLSADSAASNELLQYQTDKGGPTGPDQGLAALPYGVDVLYSRTYRRE